MNRHRQIPAKIKSSVSRQRNPSPLLLALLRELHSRLHALQSKGETYCIDIRSLPMMKSDHDHLIRILGKGEVSAMVNAMGPTRIRETGIPGVWWVVHYNIHNEPIAELIEITTIPDLLSTQPQELTGATDLLRTRISVANEVSE